MVGLDARAVMVDMMIRENTSIIQIPTVVGLRLFMESPLDVDQSAGI